MGHAVSLGQPGALAYEVCYAAFVVLVRNEVEDAAGEGHPPRWERAVELMAAPLSERGQPPSRAGGEPAAEQAAAPLAAAPGGVEGGGSQVAVAVRGERGDIWQQMAAAAKAAVSAATKAASAGGGESDGPAQDASESVPPPPDTLGLASGQAAVATMEAVRDPRPALDSQVGAAGIRPASGASVQLLAMPMVACNSGSLGQGRGETVRTDAEPPPDLSGVGPRADEGSSGVMATDRADGAVSQPALQDPRCCSFSGAGKGKAVSAELAGPVLSPDDSGDDKFTASTADPWQAASGALRETTPLTQLCPRWSSWLLMHGQAECAEHGVAWMIMED